MTIAAGFVHRDGVLLCADTEHTSATLKAHAAKVRHFDAKCGRIGIAYSGDAGFAVTVIQALERKLQTLNVESPFQVIRKIVDREYRRLVYTHPRYGYMDGPDFNLLLAVQPVGQAVSLHATREVAVEDIRTYCCLGAGETFGRQLIEPTFTLKPAPSEALLYAIRTLALVKEHVPGCGGDSMYLDLRHDGTIHQHYADPLLKKIEYWIQAYQLVSWEALRALFDPAASEDDFEHNLAVFNQRMRQTWHALTADKEIHRMFVEADRKKAAKKAKAKLRDSG